MIDFIKINPSDIIELSLIMAWRSNPSIYKWFFKQNEPLKWDNHIDFWNSRKFRDDYFILLDKRPIGHIGISHLDQEFPEISILIGDTTLWGSGVASLALNSFIRKYQLSGYAKFSAIIHSENIGSIKLFEKVGFSLSKSLESNPNWFFFTLTLN